MIKKGLINYFKSLKHFFTPIGVLFLGVLLGCSVILAGIGPAFTGVITRINALSEDISISFSNLADSFLRSVGTLDWNDPAQAINTVLSQEWQSETLKECLNAFLGTNYEAYVDSIALIVSDFVTAISALIIVALFFVFIGIIGGYALTKFLVRRTIAKRAWWKTFIVGTINSVLSLGVAVLCVVFAGMWKPSIFIMAVVALFLFGAASLIEAYILNGLNKVSFKSVFTPKNVFSLIGVNALIILLAFAVSFIAILIFNVLTGLVIGLALVEIAMLTASMNGESYVIDEAEKRLYEAPPATAEKAA